MDTAVLKSWCEVVRRTDPLIWALAMEASQQQENSIDSILLSPSSSCSLSSSSPSRSSLQPSPVISATVAERSDATVSTSSPLDAAAVARKKMFSLFRNSHCRSLLEPAASQSQNAMDWLKCLIQTSSSTTSTAQEDSQGHYLKQESHKETSPIHCSPVVPRRSSINDMKVSRSGKETDLEEQAAISRRVTTRGTSGSEENAPSTGSTSSTSTSNSNTSGSAGSSSLSSPKPAAANNTHHTNRQGNTNSNHQNTYYATTFNWMYYASEPAPAPAPAASAIGRFGSRSNEDHAGAQSSKSLVTISPSIATAATAAVASHLAGEREAASAAVSSVVDLQGSSSADLSNSDTTVKSHSNNSMETATNANTNSTTSVNDKPNNSNPHNTVKQSYRLENLFPFLSSTSATPITLQTTTAFITRSFHTTTTATSAFFYRTFSPTYRICTLYRDSWTDGSQLRGLERIATSFWKMDGVVLMKRSVEQMKDVCGMVRDAYGVKAKNAKAKRTQEEREKLVSDGRRRVEESIRAKENERKNVVERKRGEEDDGHEDGGDGNGGLGGGLD